MRGPLRVVLTLLVGVAVGYLLPRFGEQEQPAAQRPQIEPAAAPARHGPREAAALPRAAPVLQATNAPQTLAGILRLDSDFAETAALYHLVDGAGFDALQRLIAEADHVPGASDRRAALGILFARYADLDPAAALAYLETRGGGYGDVELRAIFHTWSRSDLQGAVAAAAALPATARAAAGSAILSARDDLSTDMLQDVAGQLGMSQMMPQIAVSRSLDQAQRDPAGAWRAALVTSDSPYRQQRLAGIIETWAGQDPSSAMNAAAGLGNAMLRMQLQGQVLRVWSGRSPQEAVDWALSQPPSPQRHQLTSVALGAMAEDDPRLAFDIARGLSGQEQVHTVRRVLMRWAADDPRGASRAVDTIDNPEVRRNAVNQIASSYARQDPDGALQWLSRLEPRESVHATALMFTMLASQDPVSASNLTYRLQETSSRAQAAANVAQAWVQQDPGAASQWVDSLADPQVRASATTNLVSSWSRFDRDAALRYAERIPDTAERESALVSIIAMQQNDPDYGEALFERLSLARPRSTAARSLYFILHDSDPRRAERFRELADLDVRPNALR